MRGRRATPKQRLVCGPCLAWVTRDERADLVVDTSPADDHVLTGPGAAEVDGAKLAEVRSQLCLLARGSYCCMFVVEVSGADSGNCHYAQNENMVACNGNNVHTIWMRSKRVTPKGWKCCHSCADWEREESKSDRGFPFGICRYSHIYIYICIHMCVTSACCLLLVVSGPKL